MAAGTARKKHLPQNGAGACLFDDAILCAGNDQHGPGAAGEGGIIAVGPHGKDDLLVGGQAGGVHQGGGAVAPVHLFGVAGGQGFQGLAHAAAVGQKQHGFVGAGNGCAPAVGLLQNAVGHQEVFVAHPAGVRYRVVPGEEGSGCC